MKEHIHFLTKTYDITDEGERMVRFLDRTLAGLSVICCTKDEPSSIIVSLNDEVSISTNLDAFPTTPYIEQDRLLVYTQWDDQLLVKIAYIPVSEKIREIRVTQAESFDQVTLTVIENGSTNFLSEATQLSARKFLENNGIINPEGDHE